MNNSHKEFEGLELPTDQDIIEETRRQKIKQAHTGKITSDELKKKIGDANRNRKLGPSWNKNIPMDEQTKQKMSATKKSNPKIAWNIGIEMAEEAKEKMSETKGKYDYFTPKGEFRTKRELLLAFPEYTAGQIERFTTYSLQGFTRKLKSV